MTTARSSRAARVAALGAAVVLFAGVITPRIEAKTLNVVTTTSDMASIAQAVAGRHATVTSICTGREDPHFIQAKPSYMVMARRADLWIRVGMELEIGWEAPILDGARNRRIRAGNRGHLDASEKVIRLEMPSQRVTRAMGDVHPSGNPHYWLDPLNGRIVAGAVAERLIQLAPEHADALRANLTDFKRRLDTRMFGEGLCAQIDGDRLWALHLNNELRDYLRANGLADKLGGWVGTMLPFRGRRIVTYHRSWTYFATRFGLEIAAELEPKPGIPPSARHLASVVSQVQAEQVNVILMEPFYSRKAADIVAAHTGAKIVVCANAVGGQAEATDYLGLIDLVVRELSQALQAGAE